ncbi:MAG TPA: hypothetical protein VEW71_04750 [Allosphingosinicella sp.]|nr:hypothetical protein [Allosphingosinicella sp.]
MRALPFLGWLFGAMFLISVGLGFGLLGNRVLTSLSGEAALAWLTFIATIWLAIWSFQKTKRKEAEAQLFPQKSVIYKELIDIIRDNMFAVKGWIPPINQDEMAHRLARVRYDMIVWGGQDTIRAIERFEGASADANDIATMFSAIARLYAAVRKDLGHSDDPQLAEDLFLAQILLDERESVRAMLRGNPGTGGG